MDTHVPRTLGKPSPLPPLVRRIVWRILVFIYPITWLAWWVTEGVQFFSCKYVPIDVPYGLLRVRETTYREGWLLLRDGTVVSPGAHILELHIDSSRARKMREEGISPRKALEKDLQGIARHVGKRGSKYVALRGRHTLRHLIQKIGAENFTTTIERKGALARLEQLHAEMAILLFHPQRTGYLKKYYSPLADTWVSSKGLVALAASF